MQRQGVTMSSKVRTHQLELEVDPAHKSFDFTSGVMSSDIWKAKYAWNNGSHKEPTFRDAIERIVGGVYAKDQSVAGRASATEAADLMSLGLWMPAGRIMAGAGTDKLVTLMNCYVNGKIEDAMTSIMQHVTFMALTMQQGGGVGTAFETIRPAGARLKRTGSGSRASGPLPFMDMWNTSGITIESAGARRGAQMGTLSDTHPDLPAFIVAKRTPGRLTNFNISVLVSDALMDAIDEDADWSLHFEVEPVERDPSLEEYDFVDDEGKLQYVYSLWKARDLWKLITENTYEYSEPGVIYIDRVNELNNLWYCEDIRATNPCGEQPLPPHNACDLGHVNLARMVRSPFKEDAYFDFDLLARTVRTGVRFLDNVLDVTNFPLVEQHDEVLAKRRIGLGYTGLADVFVQLGIRYGSAKSADLADRIMQIICVTAYEASIDLAVEKGSFPAFEADKYIGDYPSFANIRLNPHLKQRIHNEGIRNGVLLTIAPTGTSSIVYGNAQGGLEPYFALNTKRKVLQPDNSYKEYIEYPYAVKLYYEMFGYAAELPPQFVTMKDLTIHDHILIQSRTQRWVDASISKTTNIPTAMPYEEFAQVYKMAYASGCKGCTTYRPSAVRGSILEDADSVSPTTESKRVEVPKVILRERPEVLNGSTYRIKWPRRSSALYLTINGDEEGIPFEVFITSKDGTSSEWTTALSLMITAIFRKGGDFDFISSELESIQSFNDGVFIKLEGESKGTFFPSLPAYIGRIIRRHIEAKRADTNITRELDEAVKAITGVKGTDYAIHLDQVGEECPECHAPTLHKSEGCDNCDNCGYSKCG